MLQAMDCSVFASGEPHAWHSLHPTDELVEHFDSQSAAGYIRMDADVQVAALVVLLKECGPPHLEYTIRIAHPLRGAVAAEPAEGVELRVVDGIVKRKVEQRVFSVP